jgi:hypothetical protein
LQDENSMEPEAEKLGAKRIDPDDVTLNPSLFKK